MAMNKNSNVYIITYATVMVIVVAAILATTAMVLKPLQEANVKREKQMAILSSLSAEEQDYENFISALAVDAKGEVIASIKEEQVLDLLTDLKKSQEEQTYPLFLAADGRVVIPIIGDGLWNTIWGYVALESDNSTISGIVLDHLGETPGLGAEIATDSHQGQYRGKTIFEGDEFTSVVLVKGGASPSSPSFAHEVDGLSGGTKTADGVTNMLRSSLGVYVPYLKSSKGAATSCCSSCDDSNDMSNKQNVESNE